MAKAKTNNSSTVRIIGGQWRGRKLAFPDLADLRPTPDRIRETLFNWLQPYIGGARCLDMFAGSGVLGFEAASRGAASVVLLELAPAAVAALTANQQHLTAVNCQVLAQDALAFIADTDQQYDIVFLDPPYRADLWQQAADLLEQQHCLLAHSVIYLECPAKQSLPEVPANWQLIKDKSAGEVRYCLFARRDP